MGNGEPYTPLGEVMDELARRAPYHVRGPQRISNYVNAHTEESFPSGVAVRKWFLGQSHPNYEHLETFAQVFGLNIQERRQLAWAYAFPGARAA